MKPVIYVVMGTAGEYSDRSEWPVAAYVDEARARDHVEKADATAREEFNKRGEFGEYHMHDVNPYDPDMSMDYTGTSYFLYEVELMG